MIDQFRGPYAFLSNFYPCQVVWAGRTWRSVEHAYQAAKFDDPALVQAIYAAPTAGAAKHLAHRHTNRIRAGWWEWDLLVVMEDLLRQKFTDPRLRQLLLATGTEELVEGNTWGDTYWGRDVRLGGENHLGQLLMEIREELQGGDA